MSDLPPVESMVLLSPPRSGVVAFGDDTFVLPSSSRERTITPPAVTAKDIRTEFEKEKKRLVALYQQKRIELDSKGVFSPEVNGIRAHNMLLAAIGNINMTAMERAAREAMGHKPGVKKPLNMGMRQPARHTPSAVEHLEQRLNRITGDQPKTKPDHGLAHLEREGSLGKTTGQLPLALPANSHHMDSAGGVRSKKEKDSEGSPLSHEIVGVSPQKSTIEMNDSAQQLVTHSDDGCERKSPNARGAVHPHVLARREAAARHEAELQHQLQLTKRQALTRECKLQAEEVEVRKQYSVIAEAQTPTVNFSVADYMQKCWENKEYPVESVIAERAQKKRRKRQQLSRSQAPDAPQSAHTRTEAGLWSRQSVTARPETIFQTPSLIEAAGHLKTVTAPPILPIPGQPPAPDPSSVAPMPPVPEAAEEVHEISKCASPHERKYPRDLQFAQRTARARTIVQRQHRAQAHHQLVKQQGHVHQHYQVRTIQGPEEDLKLELQQHSSDSDSDVPELPSSPKQASPKKDAPPLLDASARLLEDVIVFLCQEAERKRQGHNRGQKDITVMRNVLLQCLKLLLPRLEPTVVDRVSTPSSPTHNVPRSLTAVVEKSPEPVHTFLTTSAARTLRSWTKGVEVLLTWDLGISEPLNLNNEEHLHRLAHYYCQVKMQTRRRINQLMHRWRDDRAAEPDHPAPTSEQATSGAEMNPTDGQGPDESHGEMQERRQAISSYLARVARSKNTPEAPAVQKFLERFSLGPLNCEEQEADTTRQSTLCSNKAVLQDKPRPSPPLLPLSPSSPPPIEQHAGNEDAGQLLAHIVRNTLQGTTLLGRRSSGIDYSEGQQRVHIMMQQDLIQMIVKYMKMSAEAVQGRFRGFVLRVKHDIQAGLVHIDDEAPIDEPSAAAQERQQQLEELERTLAARLLEVERDRLLQKYAHHYREKEAQLARFYDALRTSDVWSSTLWQGNGAMMTAPAGSFMKEDGVRVLEREQVTASRMNKYAQFRRSHVHRLEQLNARQLIPVTAQAKPANALEGPPQPDSFTPNSPRVQHLKQQLEAMHLDFPDAPPGDWKEVLSFSTESHRSLTSTPDVLSQSTLHELRMRRLQDLDIIWNALKVEFHEKLALYQKYDSPTMPLSTIDKAIQLWRAASEAVLSREQALQELEAYDWDKSVSSGHPLPKHNAFLFTKFCKAGLECETTGRRLELDAGDQLTYKGRPYLEKMREDYTRVLALVGKHKRDAVSP